MCNNYSSYVFEYSRFVKENYLYSVGTIRTYTSSRTGKSFKYTFSYKNNAYVASGKVYSNYDKYAIGGKFLIIFNPEDPDNNFFTPFSLNGVQSPLEGWKKPPTSIN